MRHGNGRPESGQVDDHFPLIDCVRICFIDRIRPGNPAGHIGKRLFIHREDAVFGSGFDRHVGDGEAVVHGERGDPVPCKLQGAVERSVHADHPDQMQDHVLAADMLRKRAFQRHFDRGRNFEPVFSGGNARGHVRGADAGGKRTQRTVGTGMAVRADDTLTGCDQALFRKQRMLNAGLSHVIEMQNPVFAGKVSGNLAELGGFNVLTGRVVVQNNGNPLRIENGFESGLLKHADGDRRGNIVSQDQVELCFDQVSGFDFLKTRVGGENLLGHGHAHALASSGMRTAAQKLLIASM